MPSNPYVCSNCRFFGAGSRCFGNPPDVNGARPLVNETDYCGLWKAKLSDGMHRFKPASKVEDWQIYGRLMQSTHASELLRYAEFIHLLQGDFEISRRTAEDRVKRLIHRGMLCIEESELEGGGKARFISTDYKGKAEYTEFFEDQRNTLAMYAEKLARDSLEGASVYAARRKFTLQDHLLPPLVNVAPDTSKAVSYSALHRACGAMGRGTFNRLVLEGIAAGSIVKTESGLYHASENFS